MKKGEQREVKEIARDQVASSSTYAMHCDTRNQGACDSQVYVFICHLTNKGLYSQSYAFSSNHIWIWELDHKEGWAPKNWCFWTVVLEKTLVNPLDSKEIKPVNPKGNQSWIFIGRTDAETEAPILWPPDGKNWLIGKDPDAGKDWRQEEKGMTEDEMVRYHHQLNGHESEQTASDSEGQRSWVCYSPWGHTVQHDLVSGQQQILLVSHKMSQGLVTNITQLSSMPVNNVIPKDQRPPASFFSQYRGSPSYNFSALWWCESNMYSEETGL